jgi:hypothetical protein
LRLRGRHCIDFKVCPLSDAVKRETADKTQALLQWGFFKSGKCHFPAHSVQMPTEVVDWILKKVKNET